MPLMPLKDLPFSLNCVAFLGAVDEAAKEMGSSINKMCQHLGISISTISEARRGVHGRRGLSVPHLMNIIAWSGVDIRPFIVDNDRAAIKDSELVNVTPANYREALRVIEALRAKVQARR